MARQNSHSEVTPLGASANSAKADLCQWLWRLGLCRRLRRDCGGCIRTSHTPCRSRTVMEADCGRLRMATACPSRRRRQVDARCGRKLSMLTTNISERGQPTCLECARDWAAGCAPHRMYWLVQALSRRLDGENVSEWLPHRRLAPPRYRRCLRLRICG